MFKRQHLYENIDNAFSPEKHKAHLAKAMEDHSKAYDKHQKEMTKSMVNLGTVHHSKVEEHLDNIRGHAYEMLHHMREHNSLQDSMNKLHMKYPHLVNP